MSQRRKFLAGNWKMNTDHESGGKLAKALIEQVGDLSEVDIAVFPPFVYLESLHDVLVHSKIAMGAQNLYFEKNGAFTGEISAAMLVDIGCKYVLIGHSERRHVLGESDETINRKLKAAIDAGLKPILCVGETLEEREANKTHDVVGNQLRYGLVGIPPEQFRQVTIAYEPVWAIGTGKVATPEQAEDAHAFCRQKLTQLYGADLSQSICIQYGGSVKPDNVDGILTKPNVDGALVGGASLKADDFVAIVKAGVKASK